MKLTVHTQENKEPLGDLFGIFFEDINHAADGGLYGELVQNRAFEYSSLDNAQYRPLYAWEKLEEGGKMDWMIVKTDPVSQKNPHYLVLNVTEAGDRVGVWNTGYNEGIFVEEGKKYRFSCYLRGTGEQLEGVHVAITDADGKELCSSDIKVFEEQKKNSDRYTINKKVRNGCSKIEKKAQTVNNWKKYELTLQPDKTELCGRLQITVLGMGRVELDFVSLFPKHTYKERKNGMRSDLAKMLEELHPKFMRFPGGCLVHDGSLDSEERDSLYRWKNTIGSLTERQARRDNWNYHQTLGLGYYEYFQFCEDIGAKPMPVLPAAYNPHSGQAVPMDEMQPWIDDALDLIEFANGSEDTVWGKVRCELGHPLPFGLEYLAIGNEEDAEPFFERYALFHKAIREKYPEIQIINSAGPFAAGEVYERGWASAREHDSDLIDEHYYQSPQWFLANNHRYDKYEGKTKVFLGEYASQDNKWYNALAEAAFMTGLERNAKSVGLACYAPLFVNADYVNWAPDLIWFNSHQAYGTPSYYVQKLFMNHQGEYRLECSAEENDEMKQIIDSGRMEEGYDRFQGKLGLASHNSCLEFTDIRIVDHKTESEQSVNNISLKKNEAFWFGESESRNFSVYLNVYQSGPGYGFALRFAGADEENYYQISFGGWGNADLFIGNRINGSGANLMQKCFKLYANRTYQVELRVTGRQVEVWVDGKKEAAALCEPFTVEPIYYSASRDGNGDILVKLVNASEQRRQIELILEGIQKTQGLIYAMEGFAREDRNSFEEPEKVSPKEYPVTTENGVLKFEMPENSVRIYRISPA